jgi:hypothetical protein
MTRRLGISPSRTARLAAVVVVTVSVVSVGAARAEQRAAPAADAPYTLHLTALTGPRGADLMLDVAGDAGAAPVSVLKKVQLKIFTGEGKLDDVRNLDDVAAPAGKVTIPLGTVERSRMVEADVLVQPESRTHVLRKAATTKLRPDLVVSAVSAPAQTTTSRAVDVVVDVAERNGDTGATAKVTLAFGGTTLGPIDLTVAAGGSASATFPGVRFPAATETALVAAVSGAAPGETDESNNTGNGTIDVTEHELPTPRNVLFPSLAGYGAQFGMHVYAPITPWPAGTSYGDFEAKVKALDPHLVRIFYNDNWDANADGRFPDWRTNYESFVKVVRLAQEAGATIDISYQNLGNLRGVPAKHAPAMKQFADVLEELVRTHGLTNVRWAEVGNEPNAGAISLAEVNDLTRLLHNELVRRGLRGHIRLMGGGVIEVANNPARNHYAWMQWIAANMNDVLDAYAEHVYWWYDDAGRLEYRLRDTWHLMNEVLPAEQRKPVYMMEFGIRGYFSCPGKPTLTSGNHLYYRDAACTDIWRTNIAGFQQLWFNIASAQYGVAGAAKWDAYWSRYDFSSPNNQVYWTIGPPTEGSPLTPTYHALSMLFDTTVPGWQILRVAPWDDSDWSVPAYGVEGHSSNDTPEKELAGYAGPNGELTLLGLDTNGRNLNGVSPDPPAQYSIGGLPPNTNLTLALWNATGDGTNSIADTVPTNAAGVARFQVPLHAAFALTTLPAG